MDHWRITEALNCPAAMLGVLPELAVLHPQLNVHVFETLPSTNQQAWNLVDQGAGAGTVVIAQQQTAGRGQWGREWVSPPGGLYLSIVLEPDIALRDHLLLTLASAWGIATCFENFGISVQLKWPNDLVNQGYKLGGILAETRLRGAEDSRAAQKVPRIEMAVIGVGINWLNPLPPNAISLRQMLPDPVPANLQHLEGLAAIALRGILQGYHHWQSQGLLRLIVAYQQKLANLGQMVTVKGHPGKIVGVSSTGDLIVSLSKPAEEQVCHLKPGEITLGYGTACSTRSQV